MAIDIIKDPVTGKQFSRDTSIKGSTYAPYSGVANTPTTKSKTNNTNSSKNKKSNTPTTKTQTKPSYTGSNSVEMAQQAVKKGYVTSIDEYYRASGLPTPPTGGDINEVINQNQQSNFEEASTQDEPGVRSSSKSYSDIFNELSSTLKSGLPDAPKEISLTDTFTKLRGSYGITDLETNLTDLQAQARDIQARSQARTNAEKGKAVPMNVISGRVSEAEAQENERLQAINNSIQTVSSQLETKYNIVENIMKYTGTDYANAVDNYDKKFSQNLQLLTMARGIEQDEKSKEDDAIDNARANLQIIYNNLSSGGVDPTSIDPAQKANITKLELQAGLPVGFYSNVVNKNPKADILSTTTREDGGKKYADVITRGADGKISTQSIYLGGSANEGGSGKQTEGDQKRAAISSMGRDLSAVTGSDGLISPDDYKEARREWVNVAGYTAKEFDDAFKSYIKPEYYPDLGIKTDW